MDPFRSVFNTASKEKEDFVYLNDRISDLFRKMEKMRGGSSESCSKYLETIACLEEEIKKLRTFYEAELSKQRSVVSDTSCLFVEPVSLVRGFPLKFIDSLGHVKFKKSYCKTTSTASQFYTC